MPSLFIITGSNSELALDVENQLFKTIFLFGVEGHLSRDAPKL